MPLVITDDLNYENIADAIRRKNGQQTLYRPSEMAPAIDAIEIGSTINNQNKTVTPTESQQIISADSGYTGLGTVTVDAIDSSYVGSDISRKTSSDLTISGATITAPAGYYASSASKSVASGTAGTPAATKGTVSNNSISITPSVTNTIGYITGGTKNGTPITVSASELVSGTKSITTNGNSDVTNYAAVNVNVQPTLQSKTITPTESQQTVSPDTDYDGLSSVTVGAIDSEYVGSDVPRLTAEDVTANIIEMTIPRLRLTNNVTIPAGYYPNNANLSNPFDEISITDDCTSTISATGGIVTHFSPTTHGIAYQNRTYILTSTNTVDVRDSSDLTPYLDVVQVPAGYYPNNVSASVASGSATTPVTTITANPSISIDNSGLITASVSGSQQVTPTVSSGYVFEGTAGTISVSGSNTQQLTTKGATTYTPSTTNQTIASGTYLTGTQTIVGDTDLVASNIKSGVNIFGVTGTYTGASINNQNKSVTPSESQQVISADSGYTGLGEVTVGAISSTYVGSGITQRDDTDLTVSGATVSVPSGYYASNESKSVATMTLPTSAASSATSGYTSKATINRSTSAQYINIPPGYNSAGGYYTISAVANGSATGPTSLSGSSASITTGTNTITLTKTGVTTTPTVSAGYVSSATASTATVALTASVTTKAAATITPGTSNQTIASGTYLTGTQTISGDADLTASNIKSGVNIFNVTGTYTSDATASASDIISGETAYVNGSKITGSLVINKYYTGSSAPSSSLGNNGDIYIQQ